MVTLKQHDVTFTLPLLCVVASVSSENQTRPFSDSTLQCLAAEENKGAECCYTLIIVLTTWEALTGAQSFDPLLRHTRLPLPVA